MRVPCRDFHEDQVNGLVTIHGPADALEPSRAAAMATAVLAHSIVKCNNRQAATGIIDTHLQSPFLCGLAPMIVPVLDAAVHRWVSGPAEIGSFIADLWFERRGGTEYLDTFDIPGLVGTAYGVALGVVALDRPLAARLIRAGLLAGQSIDRNTVIR